jgi:hypothetical protein
MAKSVGFGIVNSAVAVNIPDDDIQAAEAARVITEVSNAIQVVQDTQNECMIEMFKQMMAAIGKGMQAASTPANPNPGHSGSDHKPCKHCSLKHGRLDSQCWKLKANAASHPANRKPAAECKKGIQRYVEHKITEQWQLDKVEINKISKSFPYLFATDLLLHHI